MTAMSFPEALDDILEAVLLAAGEPLGVERLEALFDDHERPPRPALREALTRLAGRHEGGAMELLETASGYQLRIRPRLSTWVSRLWDERPQRYSRALLETLALVAYRQPVTRADIEEVRGVTVSGSIMRTLGERGWIRVVGHRDVPGRPAVYATTRAFLDDFGLRTLDELPPMHELKDIEDPFAAPEDAPPPPQSELLAQADVPLDEAPAGEGDQPVSRDDEAAADDASAGMAHDTPAGVPPRTGPPSFAELEARLSERARRRVEDDAAPGTPSTTSENDDS